MDAGGPDAGAAFDLIVVLILFLVAAGVGWDLGGRRRRKPRPLPAEWWICEACRSVNEPDKPICYACDRPRSADAQVLPTADVFRVDQRLGGTRHDGGMSAPPG
jgi:hypothetical protein